MTADTYIYGASVDSVGREAPRGPSIAGAWYRGLATAQRPSNGRPQLTHHHQQPPSTTSTPESYGYGLTTRSDEWNSLLPSSTIVGAGGSPWLGLGAAGGGTGTTAGGGSPVELEGHWGRKLYGASVAPPPPPPHHHPRAPLVFAPQDMRQILKEEPVPRAWPQPAIADNGS